jgi:hypothetical protein
MEIPVMPVTQGRRKYTLTAEPDTETRTFSVDEIAEFVEENTDRNPEVVSVTVELDDQKVGIGTTN